MRQIAAATAVLGALAVAGCGWRGELDTRTFELQYLEAGNAAQIIDPYVYGDRPNAPGAIGVASNLITVRETPDNLDKIARVLERYDRPAPSVRLRFQIIEANGSSETDPAIADIQATLQELFRFEGFRLVEEAVLGGAAGSGMFENLHDERIGGRATIETRIREVRAVGDSGTVRLDVGLRLDRYGSVIETSINVRAGQTVILGKAKVSPQLGTIILTVRPEFVQ